MTEFLGTTTEQQEEHEQNENGAARWGEKGERGGTVLRLRSRTDGKRGRKPEEEEAHAEQ